MGLWSLGSFRETHRGISDVVVVLCPRPSHASPPGILVSASGAQLRCSLLQGYCPSKVGVKRVSSGTPPKHVLAWKIDLGYAGVPHKP